MLNSDSSDLAEALRRRFADRSANVGILGLGYVGLPLALTFIENVMQGIAADRRLDQNCFGHPDVAYVKKTLHW